VRARIRHRGKAFLRVVKKAVFGHKGSPYLALMRLAGCELGDVEKMVSADGLDATLAALYDAGVYVTFEEFKGRAPIVRDGKEVPVRPEDFDNPFLRHYYEGASGGSTGVGTRVFVDLDHSLEQIPVILFLREAHGLLGVPTALWWGVLPTTAGVAQALSGNVIGSIPEKWYTPIGKGDRSVRLKHRIATEFVLTAGRILGGRMPRPETVSLDNPQPLLEWAARTLEKHGACRITAFVSMHLRICLAAIEQGIDLTGATLSGGGEPPTPAKVDIIRRTGARWLPSYYLTEAGIVGAACGHPVDGNDLHLAKDCVAVIQRPRPVPGWQMSVDAFNLTTLLPGSPKVMLNVGLDDFGVIEKRPCGCPLEEIGYTEHIREIRSYGKLTGEGVTLINSDVVHVLEDVLPKRFGGSPLDYQLVEEEDGTGKTRLSLVVNPDLALPDEDTVVATVLGALDAGRHPATFAATLWGQAGALRVKRDRPIWGAGGKFLPLHVSEHIRRRAASSDGQESASNDGGTDTNN
jgi:hypothetical protein